MNVNGNEITVHRGETFTIDRYIVNRNGSPFVVSSKYANPYILLSVSSTRYSQADRYVLNVWMSLDAFGPDQITLPRFVNTTIIEKPDEETFEKDAKEDAKAEKLTAEDFASGRFAAVYYIVSTGKYRYYAGQDANGDVFKDYEFRLTYPFTHDITSQWIEQSYLYSIRLVTGTSTDDYVCKIYDLLFKDSNGYNNYLNVELKYEAICNKDETYKAINLDRKLISFGAVQEIVVPTKLTVLSELNGGIIK